MGAGDGHAAHKCAVPGEEVELPGAADHHAARDKGDVLRICDVRVGEDRLHAHQPDLSCSCLPGQAKVLYIWPKEVACSILLQYRYIVTHGTNFSHMMHISSHSLLYYTVRVQYRVYK